MHRQSGIRRKSNEAIPGKQRDFDFFLPVLPLTEPLDRRKQGFNALFVQLVAHQLFMTGLRAKRIPASGVESFGHSFALSLTVNDNHTLVCAPSDDGSERKHFCLLRSKR